MPPIRSETNLFRTIFTALPYEVRQVIKTNLNFEEYYFHLLPLKLQRYILDIVKLSFLREKIDRRRLIVDTQNINIINFVNNIRELRDILTSVSNEIGYSVFYVHAVSYFDYEKNLRRNLEVSLFEYEDGGIIYESNKVAIHLREMIKNMNASAIFCVAPLFQIITVVAVVAGIDPWDHNIKRMEKTFSGVITFGQVYEIIQKMETSLKNIHYREDDEEEDERYSKKKIHHDAGVQIFLRNNRRPICNNDVFADDD